MKTTPATLRITEIFYSLQGESTTIGLPTVFVRLTGCPLRCTYCDTAYAFHGGNRISLDDIVQQISDYSCSHVCVTGGEPLAQPACINLLHLLCDKGFKVSLETSGARSLEWVDSRVMIVMDLKTPDSGECDKNLFANLAYLKPNDQIKFVLGSREDYQWACDIIKQYDLTKTSQILFSPSWGKLNPTDLANWIVVDRLPVRFQMQIHKLIWNDTPGH
jgi:7-carboxy-7-deazaguanine synthase